MRVRFPSPAPNPVSPLRIRVSAICLYAATHSSCGHGILVADRSGRTIVYSETWAWLGRGGSEKALPKIGRIRLAVIYVWKSGCKVCDEQRGPGRAGDQ